MNDHDDPSPAPLPPALAALLDEMHQAAEECALNLERRLAVVREVAG